MESANRSLQHLRMNLSQAWNQLLCFGQVVLLSVIGREWLRCTDNVFPRQRAPINHALTRSKPVFEFAQCVVIYDSTRLNPLKQLRRLSGIWIDSVSVIHGQHRYILPPIQRGGKCLFRGHRTPLNKRRDSMYPDADLSTGTARDLCSRALSS
jgi:hypothetical protein